MSKKILALLVAAIMLFGVVGAMAEGDLPRNETLFFGGQQWNPALGSNPLSANNNNAMAITGRASGSRTIMFETLYMYNMLDGQLYPLLAEGPYEWNDDLTVMTVAIRPQAKWNDGTPVTADDVVATWEASKLCGNNTYTAKADYIESIENVDGKVVIKCKLVDGKPANPLMVLDYLADTYVVQKAFLDTLIARNNNDPAAIMNDPAWDCPYSGPYGTYVMNDQMVSFIRNDDYWAKGITEEIFGEGAAELPVPKYIAHMLYSDNDAALTALKAGQVDCTQQFIANVQKLWEDDGLAVATYMDEAPYGICATMPTAWYNMEVPVLQVKEVRKAIAMAVDYVSIIENAMTNQSPTFTQVPRSLFNPTDGEQAMYDHDAVKDLQWAGSDIEGAKALLDSAGIVDSDGDGWREFEGKKISLNACCPNGWSDWQAAMEIVASAGKDIGIEISTYYPTWDQYQTIFTKASQTELEIFMYSPAGAQPSSPWGRLRALMSSDFLGVDGNWNGNWGHYKNDRVDEIIKEIPLTTDAAKLKELYTEATKIYLEEVPSFSLMYRPGQFHAVNETVWTGFPEKDDGHNIPPTDLTDGYGIAALYFLENVQ